MIHACQPFSLFTIHNNNRGRLTSAAIVPAIAEGVINHGADGTLDKLQLLN